MTHAALGMAFGSELIPINETEATTLAEATGKVMAFYGDIPGLNDKTLAWLGLFYTLTGVYGPRIIAARANAATAKAKTPDRPKPSEARPAAASTVLPPNEPFGAPSLDEMVRTVNNLQ